MLIIVGAFGEQPPDPAVLENLARAYSAVVVVLVGAVAPAERPRSRRGGKRRRSGRALAASWRSAPSLQEYGGRYGAGVLTVPLPLGSSARVAWSLDLEGPDQRPRRRSDLGRRQS